MRRREVSVVSYEVGDHELPVLSFPCEGEGYRSAVFASALSVTYDV